MSIPFRSRNRAPPPLPPRKPSNLRSTHDSRRAKYICSCGANNKANACTCTTCQSLLRNHDSPCVYQGRCVEPLAWHIEHEPVLNQAHCPLYSVIPKELRDLIFMYALTDSKAHSFESIVHRNARRFRMRMIGTRRNDIATDLLLTCRAVYHETWMLPLSLNPYILYSLGEHHRIPYEPRGLPYPWQVALIQSLDITVQQYLLEGKAPGFPNSLQNNLHGPSGWQPEARHRGIYVAPGNFRHEIVGSTENLASLSMLKPCFKSFCCVPSEEGLDRHFLSHLLGKATIESRGISGLHLPWSSAMRVAQARPIVHLTLRIESSDWWAWTDSPTSTDPTHHLGLDPNVGDGILARRPTAALMRELANRRRSGNHPPTFADEDPDRSPGWAATIGRMPDLKCLELVLETFTEKRAQLEQVVEAAKTWRFPIKNASYELIWDGHVDHSGWSLGDSRPEVPNEEWHRRSNAFDVRIIRFTRKRTA